MVFGIYVDTQAQINSMIKMKLLEMDRVKAVWNKYAVNKITVTIIKFWKAMIETEIYLIKLWKQTYRDAFGNNLRNTREGFVC